VDGEVYVKPVHTARIPEGETTTDYPDLCLPPAQPSPDILPLSNGLSGGGGEETLGSRIF